jgi:hypothetical protein
MNHQKKRLKRDKKRAKVGIIGTSSVFISVFIYALPCPLCVQRLRSENGVLRI